MIFLFDICVICCFNLKLIFILIKSLCDFIIVKLQPYIIIYSILYVWFMYFIFFFSFCLKYTKYTRNRRYLAWFIGICPSSLSFIFKRSLSVSSASDETRSDKWRAQQITKLHLPLSVRTRMLVSPVMICRAPLPAHSPTKGRVKCHPDCFQGV